MHPAVRSCEATVHDGKSVFMEDSRSYKYYDCLVESILQLTLQVDYLPSTWLHNELDA
jgi:hypothetical protein